MKCTSCGFDSPPTHERCFKCGAALRAQQMDIDPDGLAAKRPGGPDVVARLRHTAFFADKFLRFEIPTGLSHRYHWSAALLALMPGCGALYNHQPLKAGLLASTQLLIIAVGLLTIFEPWNNWVLIGICLWHLYAMADGVATAARINGENWHWRQIAMVWTSLLFGFGLLLIGGQYFGMGIFYLTTVRHNTLAPAFIKGDRVFSMARFLVPGGLRPGTVVFYDPPGYAVQSGTDLILVNEQSSFGVVTGMPGDRVSWADRGAIMVNGAPVTPNRMPINPNGTAGAYDFVVPPGHYAVLMTHGVSDGSSLPGLGGFVAPPRNSGPTMNYIDALVVPKGEIWAAVIFRYDAPPRRKWFGLNRGVWDAPPPGYPELP